MPACTIEQVRKEKVFEKRTSNFDAWVTYGELQVRCAALRWLPLRLVVACAVRCGAACCAALCAPLLVQGLACSKAPPPPPRHNLHHVQSESVRECEWALGDGSRVELPVVEGRHASGDYLQISGDRL